MPSRIVDVRPVLAAEGYEVVTAGKRAACTVYIARRVELAPTPAERPATAVEEARITRLAVRWGQQ